MSVRPFRDIKRKKTKVIKVGDVKIGGDHPISVQSMTNTLTTDIKGKSFFVSKSGTLNKNSKKSFSEQIIHVIS